MLRSFFKWLGGYSSNYHKLYNEEQARYIELLNDMSGVIEHSGRVIDLSKELNTNNADLIEKVKELTDKVRSVQTKLAERELQIKRLTPIDNSHDTRKIQY